MDPLTELVIKLVLLAIPMYMANSFAMLLGGGNIRLDLGRNYSDGRPVFGKGKTLRGAVLGFLVGFLASAAVYYLLPDYTSILVQNYLFFGLLASSGAILGDVVASFFKRRLGFESGKEVILLDQLDFIIGAIVLGMIVYVPSLLEIAVFIVITLIAHRIANIIAYLWKLKKVPY